MGIGKRRVNLKSNLSDQLSGSKGNYAVRTVFLPTDFIDDHR